MAKVLILGAGASCPAGYPAGQGLLPRIGEEASGSTSVQFKEAWNRWENFLGTLPTPLEVVRTCSNPEIVLSLLDLFDAAAEFEDEFRTVGAINHLQDTGESTAEELQAYFSSAGREILSEARAARTYLLECLDYFFFFRHYDDSKKPRTERDYLRRHLGTLTRGDAAITFNWDTLVERVLAEDGRWYPVDGYGFPRQFAYQFGYGINDSMPVCSAPPSELVVLKLHGSYGWRSVNDRFFLDGHKYLPLFTFPLLEGSTPLRDTDEPMDYSPSDLVLLYPSFLKQVGHPVLASIWMLASEHIWKATLVEIIGYSLPVSDSAARALLLPLILRLNSGAAQVVVRDPSAHTLKRWRTFLGTKAQFLQEGV
jgi:hypothetical protein